MAPDEGDEPEAGDPPTSAETGQERWQRARTELIRAWNLGQVAPVQNLPPPKEIIERQDLHQDVGLKKTYAYWLLALVTAQLILANTVFVVYAWEGRSWDLDASVIYVWLITTLVELVGVVLIVARYLFPRRDSSG